MKERLNWKLIITILLVIVAIFISIRIWGSDSEYYEYECQYCKEHITCLRADIIRAGDDDSVTIIQDLNRANAIQIYT